MCVRLGHLQGNLPQRVCEAVRPIARFCVKFCPQGDIRDCGAEPLPAAESRCLRQKQAKRSRGRGLSFARAPRRPPQKQGTAIKEFLSRVCVQKWVPPKAWRFRHAQRRTPKGAAQKVFSGFTFCGNGAWRRWPTWCGRRAWQRERREQQAPQPLPRQRGRPSPRP